jgi:hypothetical protein
MTYRRLSILIFAVLATSSLLRAQDKVTPPLSRSIYRNFVGSWEGASVSSDNGNLKRILVKIVIAEEPKKNRMRLDYVYINDTGTETRVRFIQLDPASKAMKMHFKGGAEDRFAVKGLEQFAQTGLGDFGACHSLGPNFKLIQCMTVHLEADKFNYEWVESTDGRTYVTKSHCSLKRK